MEPWPIVESFLNGLPKGSVGLDVGCGNGKYLDVNPDVFIVASDRSVLPIVTASILKHSLVSGRGQLQLARIDECIQVR